MDDNATEGTTRKRDVIDETHYFLLAETDDGWAVWDRTRPSEVPLVVFPADDDGFELASDYFKKANREARIRHGSWLSPLRWIAFVSGGAWIALNAVIEVHAYILNNGPGFSSERGAQVFYWMQALNSIASSVFLVAVGAYVILWLRGRPRPDAPKP